MAILHCSHTEVSISLAVYTKIIAIFINWATSPLTSLQNWTRDMGNDEVHNEIPFLDFSGEVLDNLADERWKEMCSQVRDALETHGFFVMYHDKIPKSLREDMFEAMNTLFDLPEETKSKYVSSKPYRSYLGKSPTVPLHQSFGIDYEPGLDVDTTAQAFTNLMWPQGNPSFWWYFSSF